jgi:hypothetical protein
MPRRGGRPSRQYLEDTKRMQEKRKLREVGMLTGGQAKLDKNKNNRIDAEDFKILRSGRAAMNRCRCNSFRISRSRCR